MESTTDTYGGESFINTLKYMLHANFTATHSGPLYSAILGEALTKSIDSSVSIKANLHPLPFTKKEKSIFSSYSVNIVVVFIMVVAPFIPAAFAAYIVREREVKAKQQQLVSGIGLVAYWLATWIW